MPKPCFSFHTQAAEPVAAYGLTVAPPAGKVGVGGGGGSRIGGGGRRGGGGVGEVCGGRRWTVVGGVVDDGNGCGGLRRCGVETAFEVEAQTSFSVFHVCLQSNTFLLLVLYKLKVKNP
ncbi:hypothetical protein HanHA89_Chr15g0615291 [Helianthus annuus]|nr:hypothetical protein HanHA89_Chr15g0615291 [Helianthus annuus]